MTTPEFEKAIYKGMGRCVIELASKERRAVHQKTLLECCCKNISEYIPLDNSKGKFLYILVKKYNDDNFFLNAVIDIYSQKAPDCENDYKLLVQMTEFLWAFSKEDNISAYDVLMNKYLWVKEELCKETKNSFLKDFFEFMSLKFIENERFGGFIRTVQAIDYICKVNNTFLFSDFCTILDLGKKTFRHKKILQEVSLYASRKMYNYFYISFKTPMQTELLMETESIQPTYDIKEICSETMRILQQTEKSKEEEIFGICKKIIVLHESKQKKRIPKELLNFVYENSPSSALRWQAVQIMGKKKMISPELAKEAIYDCNENIVRYIKQYHAHLFL